jgi:hypothetical protein
LKTLRAEDFEEKEQHDANELRAEVHHDYNEGHMADKASRTHKAVPHKKKAAPKRKSAKESPSPARKSRSPSPAPKSRSPSPAPKSRSPSPAPKSRSPSPAPKRKSSPSPAPKPRGWLTTGLGPSPAPAPKEKVEEEDAEQSEETGAWMLERILLLIVIAVVTYLGTS